jgi:hypothetical protein
LAEFSMHIHILDDGIAAAFELADDLAADFMRAHKPRTREKGVAEASKEPDLANDEHHANAAQPRTGLPLPYSSLRLLYMKYTGTSTDMGVSWACPQRQPFS